MASSVTNFMRLPFFGGGNPINANESVGNPEALMAVVAADGPGTGITVILCAMAASTKR